MMRLVAVLAITLTLAIASLAQQVEFFTQYRTMEAGQITQLMWNARDAQRVFISGVGIVASKGSRPVKPDKTTSYMLIAEGKFGIVFKTVNIEVTGSRGADYPTDYDSFKYPVSNTHKAESLVVFMDKVFHALQDNLECSAYGPFPAPSGSFIFVTNFKRRGDLVQPGEETIAERHISYLVEIENNAKQDQAYSFTVRTLVEYRRKLERAWRVEEREDIYRSESNKVRAMIDALSK